MFLCDRCHDVSRHIVTLFQSLGRCEECGRTAPCIDCQNLVCPPPTKKVRKGLAPKRRS